MGVNKAALKSPSGLIKILCLVLTLIVLIMSRSAFSGSAAGTATHATIDERWLSIITAGSFTIILGTIVLTYLLGDGVPLKMELIFMVTGCILFLATGACTIQHHDRFTNGSRRDTGLAMGSIAVINGIVMFVDVLLMAKVLKSNK